MLNMMMPSICVEAVDNGYVIQWKRKISEEEIKKNQSSDRTVSVTKVARNQKELIQILDEAAKELNK